MKYVRGCLSWGLGVALIVLSPVLLIFALPVAIGVGLDIFERAGEAALTIALCLPLALVLLGRTLARPPVRHAIAALTASRPRLGLSTRLNRVSH